MTYVFGEFEVDAVAYEVRQAGTRVRLTRQPMEILLLLLEHRQELVSREDMAKRLWSPEVFTDPDAGIHTAILKIRQALGDSRDTPRFIETVPGKGYRFVAPVDLKPPPAATRRHNLPAEATSFVGRQAELRELPGHLASSRLVSLTGAGGVGKTRLATRVATSLVDVFDHGVWLVDLAPLAGPELLAQTVAVTLGIREGSQRSARDVLLDALQQRQLLLVLDTCEHLISPCADLADALLRRAPGVRIVTTSREALGVPGELVYRVASLAVDGPGGATAESDAARLFIDRARAVDPTFEHSNANAGAIDRICHRLDGIPLAIELAAARAAVLSPDQIEGRLHDRFRLLTGGARTAVARQRTLEATVDWSVQLLSATERLMLGRLSVFPAAWSLEAAEYVCGSGRIEAGEVLDLLAELVSKSLVMVERRPHGARRYRLLETIRQFARDRLIESKESEECRRRHFEFFWQEFRGALPLLRHHHQLACLRRIGIEQDNLRAALDWALGGPGDDARGVELAGALFWFWTKRGLYEEGRLWLERAVAAASPANPTLRARVLIGLAHMRHFQMRPFDDLVSEALTLGRSHGDRWTNSFALFMQGLAAFEGGDHVAAASLSDEARVAAGPGDEMLIQHSGPLLILANIAVSRGDYDAAQRLYDEAIDVDRQTGEAWSLGILLSASAGLRIVRGELARAHAQASEALSICQELEDPRGIAWSLDVFAGVLAAGGLGGEAARAWGAADRLLESVGGALSQEIRWIRDRYLDSARQAFGHEEFDAARAEGRDLPLAEAIARARTEADLRR